MSRIINSLGKSNKAILRNESGIKRIDTFMNDSGLFNKSKGKKYTDVQKEEAYQILADQHNELINMLKNEKKMDDKIVKKNKKVEDKKKIEEEKQKIEDKKKADEEKIIDNNIKKSNYSSLKEDELDLIYLRALLKDYIGEWVMIEYIIPTSETINPRNTLYKKQKILDNYVIFSKEYLIPTQFSKWWKKESKDFYCSSEMDMFRANDQIINNISKRVGVLSVYKSDCNVKTENIIQKFLDGISHCVFTPIKLWAVEKYEKSESKQAKSRYNNILKSLTEYEETYKNGVPENAIPEICNKLQIDISIELPFCEDIFIKGESIKKKLKLFKFINSRLNHIDLNEITNDNNVVIVSRDELIKIQKNLNDNNMFYTFKKDTKNINSISTLTHQYKLSNHFSETMNEFEIETGLKYCKIDDFDDFDLSQFIHKGVNYNGTVDFNDNKMFENIKHIDMKKAYVNYKTCMFYEGFLGKITDFRKTDKIVSVGMYMITNLDFSKCNIEFMKYNEKMKIYMNDNVYTSPELNMLSKFNVTYKILSGCWGVKPLDFDYNDTMINTKDDYGVSYYAKYAGVCDMHNLEKRFWIKCEKDYFEIIRSQCGKVGRWYDNEIGEGVICYPKKHNYHLAHITAFITAYQRLNVIEQLMEIDMNNVIRVCVDGIYHIQENVNLKNVFRTKEEFNFVNAEGDSYVSNASEKIIDYPHDKYHEKRDNYNKQLHLGAGGCGKTHMNLNDKGLQRVLFIAPSWKLAINKKKETGINATVWARALSDDPEKINYIREKANVLIIDEVSMLSENQKLRFFELYGDMKIIMCGDLGYQLPCITGEEITEKGFNNIVEHNNDYRCADEQLRYIKTKLREFIKDGYDKKEINEWVIDAFKKLNRYVSIDVLKRDYKIEDMILSGTNEIKDFYTGLFQGKFKNSEKYYITENNRLYSNGEILICEKKPEQCKSEIRHCFTTHSIQGETAYNKLYIDASKMFDSRMFYTAISRAKTLEQIFIVDNELPIYKYEYGKIYKIINDEGLLYIGSTTETLEQRLSKHKRDYENYCNGKGKYITSFKLFEGKNIKITKIENFKCNELTDLWKRESEIIKSSDCVNKTFNEEEKGNILIN